MITVTFCGSLTQELAWLNCLLFGGVSIIALGDLFQLEPVMDGYVFKDIKNSEYAALRYVGELFSFP